MSALGAEVVWTRLLSLMLGGTVYTFSLILAVFLIGLGIGSSLGAFLRGGPHRLGSRSAACQWLLTAAIAWASLHDLASHSRTGRSSRLCRRARGTPFSSTWCAASGRFCRRHACGARAFRWRWRRSRRAGQDPGRLVGGVYAANTLGAIAGALVFSLLLVPDIGTAGSERALIGLAAARRSWSYFPLLRTVPRPGRLGGAVALAAATGRGGLARLER